MACGALLVYGCSRDDLFRLMADHGVSPALVADTAGLGLLHEDGQEERLTDRLDPSSAWKAWKPWAHHRRSGEDDLHGVYYPPGTLAAHRALAMATRRRLDERYGHESVETMILGIMDRQESVGMKG